MSNNIYGEKCTAIEPYEHNREQKFCFGYLFVEAHPLRKHFSAFEQ